MRKIKSIFKAIAFMFVTVLLITSCQKEDTPDQPINAETETNTNTAREAKPPHVYTRAYIWVGDILDCTAAGHGCVILTSAPTANGSVDLSILQALVLIEAGSENINDLIVNRDLSYEFPTLYEEEIYAGIESGEISLYFEFPYLKVQDNSGEIIKIYNYESTISNEDVNYALKEVNATRQVKFNTDEDIPAVWDCTSAGNNCKVSAIAFNGSWLSENPEFISSTNTEEIVNTEIDNDGLSTRVVITTESGSSHAIQFKNNESE